MRSLSHNRLGAEGAAALAPALAANGSLTSLNLSSNNLCSVTETGYIKASQVQGSSFNEGDKVVYQGKEMIVSKAKDRDGDIKMTNLPDMSGLNALADASRVNGGLTSVDVRRNNIAGDGAVQLAAAVLRNLKIEMFNEIPIKEMRADSFTELDLKEKHVGVEGGLVVADLIPVMGGLTALDLSSNSLKDEGVSAVCKAIQTNKETKLALLNFKNNGIGPSGANAVAAMVAVIGALTRVDVRHNNITGDGAAQLSAAVLGNLKIEMFNEIPIKEMRANSLTELDLNGKWVGVEGGMVVAGLIPVMGGALTQVLVFRSPWISLFCSLTIALL